MCQAGPGLSGDANLTDVGFCAEAGEKRIPLLSFPVNPDPNTKVGTNLDAVLRDVVEGVESNLDDELDMVTEPVKRDIIEGVVAKVTGQVGPLEDNILEGTLNKQSRSNDTINVTALDLEVPGAAEEQLGASLLTLKVGDVSCGTGSSQPGGGPVAGATRQNPQAPTVVTSGEPGANDEGLPAGAVGGILALLGASALVGYHRVLGR